MSTLRKHRSEKVDFGVKHIILNTTSERDEYIASNADAIPADERAEWEAKLQGNDIMLLFVGTSTMAMGTGRDSFPYTAIVGVRVSTKNDDILGLASMKGDYKVMQGAVSTLRVGDMIYVRKVACKGDTYIAKGEERKRKADGFVVEVYRAEDLLAEKAYQSIVQYALKADVAISQMSDAKDNERVFVGAKAKLEETLSRLVDDAKLAYSLGFTEQAVRLSAAVNKEMPVKAAAIGDDTAYIGDDDNDPIEV